MTALRRDRLIVAVSLAVLIALSWAYFVDLTFEMERNMPAIVGMGAMEAMPGMAMPAAPPFAMAVAVAAIMWAVMMAGMMLPSAAPMILLFVTVRRKRGATPMLTTGIFVAGYLLVWSGFSIVAAALQISLAHAALLTPALTLASTRLSGLAFLLAALYELTPLKTRCLAHCVSPLAFITGHWRPGTTGALRMGIAHGTYCLGCCWVLMLLLFVAGVMNLLWVVVLAALVLAQKVLPWPRASTVGAAIVLAAVGSVLLFR